MATSSILAVKNYKQTDDLKLNLTQHAILYNSINYDRITKHNINITCQYQFSPKASSIVVSQERSRISPINKKLD